MTENERNALLKRLAAQPKADTPEAPAPAPERAPAQTEGPRAAPPSSGPNLFGSQMGAIFAQYATPSGRAAASKVQAASSAASQEHFDRQAAWSRPADSAGESLQEGELTIGDALDIDPAEMERAGLHAGATLVRNLRGQETNYKASPFSTEWGTQRAENLRIVPLQKLYGAYGTPPEVFERQLRDLYFQKAARLRGLPPIHQMDKATYTSLLAESSEAAQRQVAGVVGASERRANTLVELKTPQELALDVRDARGLPIPAYATPALAAVKGREFLTGAAPRDQLLWQALAPFAAMARPGTAGIAEGEPATAESKLSWLMRLAPSTAVASWLLDPELEWSMGGEKGWGGQKHIEKIVSGYDLLKDYGRVAKMYDEATPWESGVIERNVAAAIPIGLTLLFEPDLVSVGTGLLASPVAKGYDLIKTGSKLLDDAIIPASKEMLAVVDDAGIADADLMAKLDDVVGPKGTVRRMTFDAVIAETQGEIAAEGANAVGKLSSIEDLDPLGMRNLGSVQAQAAQKAADALAQEGVAAQKVGGALADELAKKGDLNRAQQLWTQNLNSASQDAANSIAAYRQSEDALVQATALRTGPIYLFNAGDKAYDVPLGEWVDIVGPGTAIRGTPDYVVRVPSTGKVLHDVASYRLHRPGTQRDARAIFADMAALKKEIADIKARRAKAGAAGQFNVVKKLNGELRAAKHKVIINTQDLSRLSAEAAYLASADAMRKAVNKAQRMAANPPTFSRQTDALVRAQRDLQDSLDKYDLALRRAGDMAQVEDALKRSRAILRDKLVKYIDSFEKLSAAGKRRELGVREMGEAVLDRMAGVAGNRATVNGTGYAAELVAKYGQEAVDEARKLPGARDSDLLLKAGNVTMDIDGLQRLREFERSVFGLAEKQRMDALAPAGGVLRTLAEYKGIQGWSKEAWLARGYQMADYVGRAKDWVGGTAIGKATKPIREIVRRSFERFAMYEHDLGLVAKDFGPAGIEEYLTTTRRFDGVVGNQDPLTLADKAVAYLRAIRGAGAAGRNPAWDDDVIVKALANAPLPSFMAATIAPGAVRTGLGAALDDPAMSGAALVKWLSSVPSATYQVFLGRADSDLVVARFIGRAVSAAAAQHDTLYELSRAGALIDTKAAKAIDWFTAPERGKLAADFDFRGAYRAMTAFGMPKLVEREGAIPFLLARKRVSNGLLKVAQLEGEDFYLPRAMWDTMQEVPRNLAKDLVEFSSRNRALSLLDRWSRLWRVATVNGYVLPRAAHFVNTWAGDWSQMVQQFGWRAGTRLAMQSSVTYVPLVGARIADAMSTKARTSSIFSALFSPALNEVMKGGDYIIETADGPMTARQFMREAFEDGVKDSISTKDLLEATSRHQQRWSPWTGDPPPHIEAAARFMETIQHRNRLAVYLEARNGRLTGKPMGRKAAREALVGALYDWKTGIPSWEHQFIGRVATFWSYRRSMMRQLGGVVTEAFTEPDAKFMARALAGRTKYARTRQLGGAAAGAHEAFTWQDPEEYLDDDGQLELVARTQAPWWVKAQAVLSNRALEPARELWYSDAAGRKVTHEAILLPALTTADQMWMLNLVLQTMLASTVMLAEQAGLKPSMTTVGAAELWERNVDGFADSLAPGVDDAVSGALRPILGRAEHEGSRGPPVPIAQSVMLKRLGFDDFLGVTPDPDGQLRFDPNAAGVLASLAASFPPLADAARNWVIFAENPGYQESVQAGLLEALTRWTGVMKPAGHAPLKSLDYEAQQKERALKAASSDAKKEVLPREDLYRR